jgi:hypothetical protein
MSAWVLRAAALGGFIVLIRFLLEQATQQWPTQSSPLRLALFVVVLAAALCWGWADGRRDRVAYPNPDDGEDLTILWLEAAVAAGLAGGLAAWLIALIPGVEMGGNSLFFELTSGAAFVVLILFLPATLGVGLARRAIERRAAKAAAKSTPPKVAA